MWTRWALSPRRRPGPNASAANWTPAYAGVTLVSPGRRLDVEGLTTPATILLVRVVELEALVQALAHEVELGAVEVREALGIHQHAHAVALELRVLGLDL